MWTLEQVHSIACLVLEFFPIKNPVDGYNWKVEYYLNVPLRSGDGRAGRRSWKKVRMGGTRVGSSNALYPFFRDERKLDTPFRDGAHIQWDAQELRLPMFSIYGDHVETIKMVATPR